jgi:Flp pilus assembly protein CpaB
LVVLVSVALGVKVVGDAEDADLVWAASRDLPAGSTLHSDDLEARSVRMPGTVGAYVDASGSPPAGYVVLRDIAAGELVPAAALDDTVASEDHRLVSIPVAEHHYPSGLARGHRVDVYVVPAAAPGVVDPGSEPVLVLSGAAVAEVSGELSGFGAGGSTIGVVLEVGADDVAAVVEAVGSGSIQLVRIPDGASAGSS